MVPAGITDSLLSNALRLEHASYGSATSSGGVQQQGHCATVGGTLMAEAKNLDYARVAARMSLVLPFEAHQVWDVLRTWSKQAQWMGEIEGKSIFTQLLVRPLWPAPVCTFAGLRTVLPAKPCTCSFAQQVCFSVT